ncbi:MAG: N-acetylmuramoyl-L-alanine amidase [Lachnospiraceae bacterium]|nr:N-acetylmuramoyl-L-alanine amidase [Lachnospiraceae bacterium]
MAFVKDGINRKESILVLSSAILVLLFSVAMGLGIFFFRGDLRLKGRGMQKGGLWNPSVAEEATLGERLEDRIGYLTIPLPDEVGEDEILIVENYHERRILVTIPKVPSYFFQQNLFSGDMTDILNIRYGYQNGVAQIELDTNGVMVPVTYFEGHRLFLQMRRPWEVYERIMVIDPGHGGDDTGSFAYGIEERDIVSAVALELEKAYSQEDVKVYVTHPNDSSADNAMRGGLADEVGAGIMVSLHTAVDERTRTSTGLSLSCRQEQNALGERIADELAKNTGFKNLGVKLNELPELFQETAVPLYYIRLGHLTNKKEAEAMAEKDFSKTAAAAIKRALEAEGFTNRYAE